MDSSTQFSSEACLGDWFANFAPGELKLADGRLSFMAIGAGTLFKWQRNKLEQKACQPGLADRMGAGGGNTVVFDLPLAGIEVVFPRYLPPTGIAVRAGGVQYGLTFGKPPRMPNTLDRNLLRAVTGAVEATQELRKTMHLGKAWKDALSNQSSPPQT